ncbi:tape measure protein [Ectopseudomonas khazarica]|uniref:tape measure protein n=1 Tax=Ectopseudomonas khazarica TaxID=2502979 RepID=UPI001AEF375A|nr:tape measure protein [Pseudomonas khazarica]QTS88305.1 tape measure protein [Pseudomonas khazarica]
MADVELRLVADVDNAVKGIGSLSKEYQGLVNQLAKPLRQVNAFRELESSLEGTERQTRSARDRVRELGDELARTAEPSKQLTAQYRDAVNELRRLERAEGSAQQQLARRRRELQAAGVDTRNLVAEQRRLGQELQGALGAGQADQRLRSAQSSLGVGEIEQTQRQLVELRNEYRLVMAEGDLSAKQRAEAEANYRRSVTQTLAALRQLRAASAPGPTRNDAQAALQAEAAAAADAAEQQRRLDAQRTLGVGRIEQTQQSLVSLRAQYREVMADASLSGRERSEAETVYHQRVRQTLTELRNMRAAIADQGTQAQRAAAAELQRSQAARQGIRAQSAALAQLVREQRAAGLEAARQNLGVTRYRELQGEIGRVRTQYQLLRSSGKLTTQELAIAQRSMTERVRETQRALREMNAEQRQASGVSRLAGGMGGAIGAVGAGYAAVSAISAVSRAADAYNLMNARLRLATTSQDEFNVAQRELSRIAQETEAPVQSLITLYGRISRPLREAGRSQQDILAVTEAVSTSFRVSGATAQEAENGVIQFAQALGAGALRGEEFNSVAEQAPRLMQALADGIGVPVGALKEMAAQGELTAQVVTDALTGQLDTLRQEAETLPDTVGGAMTKLGDRWREGIGQANVQPLIDSINSLGRTLSDPVVVDNLVKLASALASLAGTVVEGASEFADFGKRIAFIAANSQGLVTELDKVDQQIADLDRSLAGTGLSTTIDGLLYSKEELQAKRDSLVAFRASIVEQQSGLNAEVEALAKEAADAAEAARSQERADYATYIANIESLRKSQIKAAEKGAKALVSAEKKALTDLQKVRDDRLKIEQRYQEALAGLGGTGEASYSSAQDLKIGARNALANGDVEGAQRLAQQALKMLQDLAAAGENTYGFTGFIKELQQIELAANDLEQSNAEDKLASIRDEMQQLKDQAAQLKDLPVSVKTDDATVEQVRSTIETLVAQLSQKEVVIPVRVVSPDGPIIKDLVAPQDTVIRDLQVPQFATGGILRGPGTGTSDSILARLSTGEGVINARAVQYYGADLIHQLNNLRTPRFATGGVMGNVPVPSIPSLAPELQQQLDGPVFPDLGRLLLELGGHEATVYASPQEALNLQRLANKFGPSMRRR